MPAVIPLQPQFYITAGGAEIPGDLSEDIVRVEVDMHLYLPDMFTVEVRDERFRWVEHSLVHIGQHVEIAARASEDEQRPSSVLLSGEIVAVEATYPESGVPLLVLRGYDLSHRLHRGRKVRSFLQMTDSDIASRIAQERGLRPDVDSTTHVHPHLYQEALTDYEFLARRARAVGFVFHVDEKKLVFKRPESMALAPVDLDFRSSLLEFRPRLTASAQLANVQVRGWDPATKQAIIGRARSATHKTARLGWNRRGSDFAGQAFDAVGTTVSDQPVGSQAEGDAYASAHLAGLWSGDVQAEGDAVGNPHIRAGSQVRIGGVGERFGGEYFVTRVRHTFDANGQYRTWFAVGGYGSDTTADLLFKDAARVEEQAAGVTRGLAIGVVTNVEDPEKRARVKVRFPWLADDAESHWARVAMPMAGPSRGFYFLPEVNDEVLVAFEHGDFNRPYVVGALWNGEDKPPNVSGDAVDSSGAVVRRIIRTRAGHVVQFDDTAGAEKIEVIDKTGKNRMEFDSAANKITVEATTEVEIKAGQKLSISAPEVKIEGRQKVEVTGMEIESRASVRQKIAGGTVEIN